MSLAVAHNNLIFIRQRRADIEYRLMMLTNQLTRIAYETCNIEEERQVQMNYLRENYDSQDTESSLEEYVSVHISPYFDSQLAQLNTLEKTIQQEKLQLETQSKEYATLEDSISKAVDSNIKNSFSYFK